MCLGVPGRILSIAGDFAEVDFWGVVKSVRLDIVDEPVAPGDYVLNHVGFAIRRIPAEDIAETVAMYDELLARADSDDLMAADVRSELAASDAAPGTAPAAPGAAPAGRVHAAGDAGGVR
jgi:hydrogenase expression/formation protein HypC